MPVPAGVTLRHIPAWMLSAHPLVAEWTRGTSCLNAIIAAAEPIKVQLLPNGRVEVRRTVDRLAATLRGFIDMGTLIGVIELSRHPVARYVDAPTPGILIVRTELPEAAAASISESEHHSNPGQRLSAIINHPLGVWSR